MSIKTQAKKKQQPRKKIEIRKDFSLKENLIAVLVIAALSLIAFRGALDNDFVNLDDDRYVTDNPRLIVESYGDIFSIPEGYHMGNYHPFTMVIFKFIHGRFGNEPFAYHLVNLLIHLLNSLLAYFFIRKLTGKFFIALAAGMLFAVHTMHVESVAWASELKDLLYAFFYFLALIVYLHYLKDPKKPLFLLAVLGLFICSLLSKAMAASLPVVLLLIDYYRGRKVDVRSILEKLVFVAAALIFGLIAISAQKTAGAIPEAERFTLFERMAFACYGYVTYLWKLVIPVNLSAYYAYPPKIGGNIPGYFYIFPLLLLAVVGAALYSLRKTRVLFFGIGFYSVTVFLVLQLLPVGGAIMADRYSYIPSLGILFLFAYGLNLLYEKKSYRYAAMGLLGLMTISYTFMTINRCEIWRNGMALWTDVVDKSNRTPLSLNNLGVLYNQRGRSAMDSVKYDPAMKQVAMDYFSKAQKNFDEVLRIDGKDNQAWSNRGLIFWRLGQLDSAVFSLRKAIEYKPGDAISWGNLGSVYFTSGRPEPALDAYQKSVELNPNFADGWYNIGILKYNAGNKDEACAALSKSASLGKELAANAFRDLCQ